MVSEQFDSGRMTTEIDDFESCEGEDLEYLEEKLVKTQEHCGSINKMLQKMMKMLDKMIESQEEINKRTLKRSFRSDSVEKGNPDRYSNPDPNPNLDPYPESVPNLNLKLEPRSKSEIAMDVESIEGEHSVDENDEEKKKKDESRSDSFGIWSNSDLVGESVEESPRLRRSLQSPPLPPSLFPLPPPPQDLPLLPFPPLQRDSPSNLTEARNKKLGKPIKPNLLNLFWPWPIQVSTTWPKSRKDFNRSAKSTPNFTTWATSQRFCLAVGRGKLPPPLPPPLLPIPPQPPPCLIEVYREWFQSKLQNPFCSYTCEIFCTISVNVYVAIHPFNEKEDHQVKRDEIMRFVMLLLYPQFSTSTTGSSIGSLQIVIREDKIGSRLPVFIILSRYGEHLPPQKLDHRVTSSSLGRFFGSLTFAPTMKFFGTEIPDTSHVEMVAIDDVVNRLTVSKYVEEAQQKLKVKLVLKGNGSFMAEQFEVRKSRWWRENNGGRFFGTKDTSVLRCDLKPEWKGLSFLEVNWEDYVTRSQEFNVFFWNLASEEKGSGLTKHQGFKKFMGWCKDEVDRFRGPKTTSRHFSTTRAWLGDDHQKETAAATITTAVATASLS